MIIFITLFSELFTKEITQFVFTLFKEYFVEFNYAYSFLTTCLNKPSQDHLIQTDSLIHLTHRKCTEQFDIRFKSYRSYQMDIEDMIWKLVKAKAQSVLFQNGCNV
jgi:hypothetical protein